MVSKLGKRYFVASHIMAGFLIKNLLSIVPTHYSLTMDKTAVPDLEHSCKREYTMRL